MIVSSFHFIFLQVFVYICIATFLVAAYLESSEVMLLPLSLPWNSEDLNSNNDPGQKCDVDTSNLLLVATPTSIFK